MKARKSYIDTEKNAKKQYNSKLKERLAAKNISSKMLWRAVNAPSGKSGHADIPCHVIRVIVRMR